VTRRTPLLLGLYALTASTVLFCFGKSPAVLVIARGLQGASTSVIWVVGLALLSDTMGVSNSGGAMGWQGIGRFAGMLLGPSLSGVVYQSSGHYAVFGMGFAVLILDIILRFVMIERKVAERWISFNDTSTSDDIDPTQPLLKAYDGPRDLSLDRAETFRNVTAISSRPSVTEVLDSQVMAIVPLLSSIRILAALSTYFTCAILTTALESVSFHVTLL
jgi:MFS family permease